MTIDDVLVANVAEGRERFATQLSAYKDYTADLALDGDTNNDVGTPPHCAQPHGDSGDYTWWMVDLGKQYVIDSVIIYSSERTSGILLKWS